MSAHSGGARKWRRFHLWRVAVEDRITNGANEMSVPVVEGFALFPVSSWGAGRRAQRLLANRSHGSPPPSQLRVRIPLAISTKINASDKNPDITNEGCQMALYGPYDAI